LNRREAIENAENVVDFPREPKDRAKLSPELPSLKSEQAARWTKP
jgi:hypothetical protein